MDDENPVKKLGISIVASALVSGAAFLATKNRSIVAAASIVSFIGTYVIQ